MQANMDTATFDIPLPNDEPNGAAQVNAEDSSSNTADSIPSSQSYDQTNAMNSQNPDYQQMCAAYQPYYSAIYSQAYGKQPMNYGVAGSAGSHFPSAQNFSHPYFVPVVPVMPMPQSTQAQKDNSKEENDEEESDDDPTVAKKPSTKASNILPFWGNEKTMNLNTLILTNIQQSPYFKVNLFGLKTYHEVIDEIFYHVKHLEPWEKGSRKVSSITFAI